jgi:hypothetical protein
LRWLRDESRFLHVSLGRDAPRWSPRNARFLAAQPGQNPGVQRRGQLMQSSVPRLGLGRDDSGRPSPHWADSPIVTSYRRTLWTYEDFRYRKFS